MVSSVWWLAWVVVHYSSRESLVMFAFLRVLFFLIVLNRAKRKTTSLEAPTDFETHIR